MSVTLNPGVDWTVRPGAANAYGRSNAGAVLTAKGGPIQSPGTPSMSDPSTGAWGQYPPALMHTQASLAVTTPNMSSFWFVTALLFLTMWLESGKRGSI
jgi:hypothetical protein